MSGQVPAQVQSHVSGALDQKRTQSVIQRQSGCSYGDIRGRLVGF